MGKFIHDISNSTDLAWVLTIGMRSPSILERLPNELIAMVVEVDDLSKDDLTALRLTCKASHPWATKRLARDHLSRICIAETTKDFEFLAEICEHQLIGPYVRSIQLDYRRTHPMDTKRMAYAECEACDHARARSSGKDNRLNWYSDGNPRKDGMKPIKALTRAFAKVKSYGHALSLATTNWYEFSMISQHQRVSDYTTCEHSKQRIGPIQTLWVLFQAVVQSGVLIDGLSLHCWDPSHCTNSEERILLADFTRIYSRLKLLNLEVYFCRPHPFLERQLLPNAIHLETIHLDLFSGPPDARQSVYLNAVRDSQMIFDCISSDSLANVTLQNLSVSVEALVPFLLRHQMTLICLKIINCALLNGSWYDIISCFHGNISSLIRLELSNLYLSGMRIPGRLERFEAIKDDTIGGDLFVNGYRAVQSTLETVIGRQSLGKTG